MGFTRLIKLFKPSLTDKADITSLNQNWDKVEAEITNLQTTHGSKIDDLIRNNNANIREIDGLKGHKFDDVVEGTNTLTFRANGVDKKTVRFSTGGGGGTTPEAIDNLQNQINELYKNGSSTKSLMTSVMELGSISSSSGDTFDETLCIRTRDYVSVLPNTTYYMENGNGYSMYPNAHMEDKTFIKQIGKYTNPCVFTTPENCRYIKFRTSATSQNDLSTKFRLYEGSKNPNGLSIGEQNLISFDNGYVLDTAIVEETTRPAISLLQTKQNAETGYEVSVLEVRTPQITSRESTFTLMRGDAYAGEAEYIDITDKKTSKGRKCSITVQKRGRYAKQAPFDISFDDSSGVHDILRVYPDGVKTEITSDGLLVNGDKVIASGVGNGYIPQLIFGQTIKTLSDRISALENNGTVRGVRLISPYDTRDSNKVKVQLHAHSTNSDGKQTNEELQAGYLNIGFTGIAITNHNNGIAKTPIPNMILWRGIEESTSLGHLGIINIKSSSEKFDTSVVGNEDRYWSKVTSHHRAFKDDRFIICNHPSRPNDVFPNDVLLEMDYDMMEVYNSKHNETTTAQFDYVLNNGKKIWCVATDDCHNITNVSNFQIAWVEVYSNNVEKEYIFNRMRNGCMIACVGYTFDISTANNIITATAQSPTTFEFINNGHLVRKESNVLTSSFEVGFSNIGNIRVVAYLDSDREKRAYSQPMYVEF